MRGLERRTGKGCFVDVWSKDDYSAASTLAPVLSKRNIFSPASSFSVILLLSSSFSSPIPQPPTKMPPVRILSFEQVATVLDRIDKEAILTSQAQAFHAYRWGAVDE